MNRLLDIQQKLQETTAALARMQRSVVQYPDKPSLLASLRSFEKRRASLEQDFLAIAITNEVELSASKIPLLAVPEGMSMMRGRRVLEIIRRLQGLTEKQP
jgi:hypothetical protein